MPSRKNLGRLEKSGGRLGNMGGSWEKLGDMRGHIDRRDDIINHGELASSISRLLTTARINDIRRTRRDRLSRLVRWISAYRTSYFNNVLTLRLKSGAVIGIQREKTDHAHTVHQNARRLFLRL